MFKGRGFIRSSSLARLSIAEHFSKYKWVYIILGSVCLCGLIIGFIVGFNRAENIKLKDLPDTVLVAFINKDITNASVFFSRFFAFIGILILVWLTNCKPFLCWITFIVLLYRAFIIGINCALLIVLYEVGGIINVIIIFLPCHLFALFALLIWCVVCFYNNLSNKNLGYHILSIDFIVCVRVNIIVVNSIALVAYLLEALLIPCLTSAVFIGYSQ